MDTWGCIWLDKWCEYMDHVSRAPSARSNVVMPSLNAWGMQINFFFQMYISRWRLNTIYQSALLPNAWSCRALHLPQYPHPKRLAKIPLSLLRLPSLQVQKFVKVHCSLPGIDNIGAQEFSSWVQPRKHPVSWVSCWFGRTRTVSVVEVSQEKDPLCDTLHMQPPRNSKKVIQILWIELYLSKSCMLLSRPIRQSSRRLEISEFRVVWDAAQVFSTG